MELKGVRANRALGSVSLELGAAALQRALVGAAAAAWRAPPLGFSLASSAQVPALPIPARARRGAARLAAHTARERLRARPSISLRAARIERIQLPSKELDHSPGVGRRPCRPGGSF